LRLRQAAASRGESSWLSESSVVTETALIHIPWAHWSRSASARLPHPGEGRRSLLFFLLFLCVRACGPAHLLAPVCCPPLATTLLPSGVCLCRRTGPRTACVLNVDPRSIDLFFL
jgi:hypothetical protein